MNVDDRMDLFFCFVSCAWVEVLVGEMIDSTSLFLDLAFCELRVLASAKSESVGDVIDVIVEKESRSSSLFDR